MHFQCRFVHVNLLLFNDLDKIMPYGGFFELRLKGLNGEIILVIRSWLYVKASCPETKDSVNAIKILLEYCKDMDKPSVNLR